MVLSTASAFADTWIKPTPEELQMTAEPAAPGAAAIYLLRDERADDKLHVHITYVRLKVLTDKGKEYADQEISYEGAQFRIFGVEGRTIHSDGTVIPFSGKPYQKLLEKGGKEKYKATVFTLPDVQVGSILEYRYDTTYDEWWAPHWYVQQSAFVRQEHFHFKPGMFAQVSSISLLPSGVKVARKGDDWDLVLNNVPAVEDEDDSPPVHSVAQRLLFYYILQNIDSVDKYWQQEGDLWSAGVDQFVTPGKLKDALAQIVAPGDTDDQKLRKIYAAVMKLDNTSFSRTLSQEENKRLKLKFRNVADIWQQQRGNDDDIAFLFIGLARAAGFKAYATIVSDLNRNIFIREQLDFSQLRDVLAIVEIGSKEMYFDPGERYCQYGKMHWTHTGSMGLRQTAKGPTQLAPTPTPAYRDNLVSRSASLHLEPDGALSGLIRVVMDGAPALRWRQEALLTDEQAAMAGFEKELLKPLPDGVEAKMNHFVGLTDSGQLVAIANVSGHLGTRTGKRLFLPGEFFEARATPRFAPEKRQNPVDLRYPFIVDDAAHIELAPGLNVETIPVGVDLPLGHWAEYQSHYVSAKDSFEERRALAVGNIFYKVDEYPQLRTFFQKIGAQDQTQVVLIASPATDRAASASSGTN
jgi:hypothetical protein